jgi:hypothetical protein
MGHYMVKVDADSGGGSEIVAAVAGKRIIVTGFGLVSTSTDTFQFKSGTTAITGDMKGAAGAALVAPYSAKGHFKTAAGEALNLIVSSTNNVAGWLTYRLAS